MTTTTPRTVLASLLAPLLAAVLASSASLAAGSPCDDRALADGPQAIGFEQGDFGVVRRACPRTEVAVGAAGRAIIEQEDFYADLRGNARVDVSVQPFEQLELALAVEPVFYEQVIQSFKAEHIGFGDTSASMTLLAFARESFALSATARATLPTAFGYYQNASPYGFDAGLLGVVEPVGGLRLHGGLLGLAGFAVTKADPDPRGAIAMNAGADVVFFDWLAAVVDLNAQALERDALDRVTVGGGLRFALGDFGAELGAQRPVAGAERHALAAFARLTWRTW